MYVYIYIYMHMSICIHTLRVHVRADVEEAAVTSLQIETERLDAERQRVEDEVRGPVATVIGSS